MNYMLITSEVLSRLSDLFILRALIVMIVWTCSYRDVWSYYESDVVVRWFLGEYKSKSEIHRRAKKFRGEVKGATGYSCVRKYVSRRLKVFIKTHLEP